jgi:hypothetical protein
VLAPTSCAERRGRPARAAELLGAAALASPGDSRTLAALARSLALIGDVAGAEGVLRFCCAPYGGGGDDEDCDYERRVNVVAPAVHSAHAAALHDLGRGTDATSVLRRGVANAVDPFLPTTTSKASTTDGADGAWENKHLLLASVTGDGVVSGGGGHPDVDDPEYLEPAAVLCVQLGQSLICDGGLAAARAAAAAFAKALWLAERMHRGVKDAKARAKKIPNIVRREFAVAAAKKLKVRALDLVWRSHLGRGGAMVALGENAVAAVTELRLAAKVGLHTRIIQFTHSLKAPGFNPCAYEVIKWSQSLLANSTCAATPSTRGASTCWRASSGRRREASARRKAARGAGGAGEGINHHHHHHHHRFKSVRGSSLWQPTSPPSPPYRPPPLPRPRRRRWCLRREARWLARSKPPATR